MKVIELVSARWEYVCSDCKQFRLYAKDLIGIPEKCGNCDSENIFIVPMGTIKLRGEL